MGTERQQVEGGRFVEVALEPAAQCHGELALGPRKRRAQRMDARHEREGVALLGAVVAPHQQVDRAAKVAQQGRQARQALAARGHVECQEARRRQLAHMREAAREQFFQHRFDLQQERTLPLAEARGVFDRCGPRALGPCEGLRVRAAQRRNGDQVHRLALRGRYLGHHARIARTRHPAA